MLINIYSKDLYIQGNNTFFFSTNKKKEKQPTNQQKPWKVRKQIIQNWNLSTEMNCYQRDFCSQVLFGSLFQSFPFCFFLHSNLKEFHQLLRSWCGLDSFFSFGLCVCVAFRTIEERHIPKRLYLNSQVYSQLYISLLN